MTDRLDTTVTDSPTPEQPTIIQIDELANIVAWPSLPPPLPSERHSDATGRSGPRAIAQVWTDPDSDHPGPSIVVSTDGVDPETRTAAYPQYRDWLPHHHGADHADILASAELALGAGAWDLLGPWTADDTGWRATVVRQPPIGHHISDLDTSRGGETSGPFPAAETVRPGDNVHGHDRSTR